MNQQFENKVVLVTGANSGIGETTALEFARAGAKVFGVARKPETLEAARTRHPSIHWVLADVSKESEAKAMVEAVVKEAGRLDVLVNNAGIAFFYPLEQATAEQLRSQFEVNVFGLSFVTQAALPALKESRGTIVNISSAAGHKAVPGGSHYGATKAAVESLTRSWALEFAPAGVRVNAIAPGPVETPVLEKAGIPPEMIPAVKAAFVEGVPLKRMGRTEDVARWVVEIANPAVTWITGQVLSVDGGTSLT